MKLRRFGKLQRQERKNTWKKDQVEPADHHPTEADH